MVAVSRVRRALGIAVAIIGGVVFSASSAAAAPIVSLLGDVDCFGTGGVCTEGVQLPGNASAVTAGVSDPLFTDRVTNTSNTVSWTHTVDAGSYTSATLDFRTAGIADIKGPYTVFADGVSIGVLPLDGFSHFIVETFQFAVPVALLADGSVTISFTPISDDGWAIDFSRLTADSAAVPEPSSLLLLGAGFVGVMTQTRRRRTQQCL